jgi:hypothetical protein
MQMLGQLHALAVLRLRKKPPVGLLIETIQFLKEKSFSSTENQTEISRHSGSSLLAASTELET